MLAGWAVISICIIGAHGKKGHGAKITCPITQLKHHLSAILYVNNTDLLHIDLSRDETVTRFTEQYRTACTAGGIS